MKLKKVLTLLLAVVLTLSLFACAPADDGEAVKVRVAALSGATGLGMAKLMEDAAQGTAKNDYSFDVYDAPEVLLPEITSGKYDIAALPTNVAAKLYNNTKGKIQILALNTLGVLYISFYEYNFWPVFIIGIPAQIIILLWSKLRPKKAAIKQSE